MENMINNENLECSVIMPVHNAEKFIEKTLNSVINQTIKNFELICVDDCSTDKSVEIIKNFQSKDSRIKLIQNETNLKVSQTRNVGVQHAAAEWVALLDSDDAWEPEFLESVIKRRNETNALLVNSSYKYMDDDGELLESEFIVDSETTYEKLLKQNKISCSAVFVKKELLQKYPFYADKVHEDYVCWLSILKEIKVAYGVTEPLSIYRLTTGSKSRNKFKAIKMSYFSYRVHGLGFFKSLYYTFCNAINGLKKYSKIKKK